MIIMSMRREQVFQLFRNETNMVMPMLLINDISHNTFVHISNKIKGKIQGRVEEQQLKECSQVLRSKIATKIVEPVMVKYQK